MENITKNNTTATYPTSLSPKNMTTKLNAVNNIYVFSLPNSYDLRKKFNGYRKWARYSGRVSLRQAAMGLVQCLWHFVPHFLRSALSCHA